MTRLPVAGLALAVLLGGGGAFARDALPGPIDLRPAGLAPEAAAPAVAAAPKPVKRVAVPPLPRLRPTRDAAAAAPDPLPAAGLPLPPEDATPVPVVARVREGGPLAADAASVLPAAVRVVGAPIDPGFTGSTGPVADPVPAAPPPPVPAPVATLPPPPPPPPTDDIPGDPASSGFTAPVPTPSVLEPAPAGDAIGGASPLRPSLDAPGVAGFPDEPYRLVRMLQSLQDAIAQGSGEALAAQRVLRERIDARFLAAEPAVWQDPRNAEAAVTYALSGGRPDVLKRLVVATPKPAIDMRLVVGALAYVEGREVEARDNLLALDAMALPAAMAAPVALAQAALVVQADPKRAMRLLDTARLLAPGTLVEEAALRREIFVADQTGAVAKLESLVGQYLRRFRHSVYAGNFRVRLAGAISRLDFGATEAEYARLDEMLALLDPDARCELYLTVSLASLVKGRMPVAGFAAGRAVALAAPGSPEMARAQLYRAAALVADAASFETAVASLKSVERYRLGASDAALQAVVAATVDAVASGTMPRPVTAPAPVEAAAEPPDPTVEKAKAALKLADALLAAPAR